MTLLMGLAGAWLMAWVLMRFPPTIYGFYPRCPVYLLLHLRCPGCGTTRAFAALLHGEVAEALRWNALTVVSLPLIAVCAAGRLMRAGFGSSSEVAWSPSRPLLIAVFTVIALFTVVRNL